MSDTRKQEQIVAIQGELDTDQLTSHAVSPVIPEEWIKGSYLELIAAIIRTGLRREGADYLRTDGGQYWCEVGDLDLEVVMSLAVKQDPRAYQKYHQGESPLIEDINQMPNNTSEAY